MDAVAVGKLEDAVVAAEGTATTGAYVTRHLFTMAEMPAGDLSGASAKTGVFSGTKVFSDIRGLPENSPELQRSSFFSGGV